MGVPATGYIKLWRSLLANGHFAMPDVAFKLWIYLLLRAAYEPQPKWEIEPGETWVSYDDIQDDLGENGRRLGRATVARHLHHLESNGYIVRVPSGRGRGMKVRVVNWERYQGEEASTCDSSITELATELATEPATELIQERIRKTKKRERRKEAPLPSLDELPPLAQDLLSYLQTIPEYPYDPKIDFPKVQQWCKDFPDLDLLNEVKRWSDWLPGHGVKNHRLSLRNWFEGARERLARKTAQPRPEQTFRPTEPKGFAAIRKANAKLTQGGTLI